MKLKTVQPETSAAGIQIQGCGNLHATAEAASSSANWRAATARCRAGLLRWSSLSVSCGTACVQPMAQVPGRLGPIVLPRGDFVRSGGPRDGGVGAHTGPPPEKPPGRPSYSHTGRGGLISRHGSAPTRPSRAPRAPLRGGARRRRSGGRRGPRARGGRRTKGAVGPPENRRVRGRQGGRRDGAGRAPALAEGRGPRPRDRPAGPCRARAPRLRSPPRRAPAAGPLERPRGADGFAVLRGLRRGRRDRVPDLRRRLVSALPAAPGCVPEREAARRSTRSSARARRSRS